MSLTAFAELRALDVRDDRHGVAGGFALKTTEDAFAAVALVTGEDGASWHEAAITGIPSGWVVLDLLRTRGDGGWAIATDITTGDVESAFLRSDDGGESWHRATTPFEHDVQLFDLARNTEAR